MKDFIKGVIGCLIYFFLLAMGAAMLGLLIKIILYIIKL